MSDRDENPVVAVAGDGVRPQDTIDGGVPMPEVTDFTLLDQAGERWSLADHRDAATVLAFYRGDW